MTEPPCGSEPPWEPPPRDTITPVPMPDCPQMRPILQFLGQFPNLNCPEWFDRDDLGLIDSYCYYDSVIWFSLLNIGDEMPMIMLIEAGWHGGPSRLYRYIGGEYQLLSFRFGIGEYRTSGFPRGLSFFTNTSGRLVAFSVYSMYDGTPPRAYFVNFDSPTYFTFTTITIAGVGTGYDYHTPDLQIIRSLGLTQLHIAFNFVREVRRLSDEVRGYAHAEPSYWASFNFLNNSTLAELIASGIIAADITHLFIINSDITNTDALAKLVYLEHIIIYSDHLYCLHGLSVLNNLRILEIATVFDASNWSAAPRGVLTDLTPLHNLTQLEYLAISGKLFPNEVLDALRAALPNTEIHIWVHDAS